MLGYNESKATSIWVLLIVNKDMMTIMMHAGRVACCPPVSHGKYADRTDRQTPGRYITLYARHGQHNNSLDG